MISAERSSNNILNAVKNLSSWPREGKLVLEKKKTDLRFAFKNNTITHAYASSITRFDINILENAWEFNRKEWTKVSCFKQQSQSYRAMSRFLVNNFCTHSSNLEQTS